VVSSGLAKGAAHVLVVGRDAGAAPAQAGGRGAARGAARGKGGGGAGRRGWSLVRGWRLLALIAGDRWHYARARMEPWESKGKPLHGVLIMMSPLVSPHVIVNKLNHDKLGWLIGNG
jgi:hypothetical protein